MIRPRRSIALGAGIALPVLAGIVILGSSALPTGSSAAPSTNPTATATITRKTLNAQTKVTGTLGFDGSTAVANAVQTSSGADATSSAQAVAQAQSQYDAAVNERDALHHPSTPQVASARAQIAQVSAALIGTREAAAGPTPAQIAAAQAQLDQAQAGLAAAQDATSGPTPAQLAQAKAQLAQAQAGLIAAQNAAAGPSPASTAQAQAAVTQATTALTTDQAALTAAQQALGTCNAPVPTPDPSASPTPARPTCDAVALQLAIQQAQGRVTNDQAQMAAAQAALAELGSAASASQAQANLASAQSAVQSAQAALDALAAGASPSQQAQLTSAQAGLASAQAALDALKRGDRAQASANLASATAQVNAARAALDALLHPTAGQLKAANDAVAVARAQLAAARATLHAPRGIVTRLAEIGSTVEPGGNLYTLDGSVPVVLMAGATPAWRAMAPGMTGGRDVRQLEQNLQDLGYGSADLTIDNHWDAATTAAVKAWQKALGVAQTGSIDLGRIVFEPSALRVTETSVALGGTVGPGSAVLAATTIRRVVSVDLDSAAQTSVKVGDTVDIILPDGTSTTTGVVSEVGTVATAGQNGENPTISVTVTLDDPTATGALDQAPVQVAITTATATDVLAVPVEALVALLEGGYAVEIQQGAAQSYVGVQLGLFANGWVEITGNGLKDGQTVVVPG